MNNWEDEASPESTRRRWRVGIRKTLDEMVAEALAAAEQILREEGLLIDRAA
ncbi:hypothetical protein D3C77_816580 [compost metagenome]